LHKLLCVQEVVEVALKNRLLVLMLSAIGGVGCAQLDVLETGPCVETAIAGSAITCDVRGSERNYDLVLPGDYDPNTPTGLVIALHGGGGNKGAALRTTCPWGDIQDPACLHKMAGEKGFAVAAPNGTASFLDTRTWNAGGGVDEFRCVSGKACEEGVDDVAFIGSLLDDIGERMNLDPSRIYVTGLSNGGAMAHRLACEMSDRITAIAAVGGAMQFTTSGSCRPERIIPILQIHGSEDPCWPFAGGSPECPVGSREKRFVAVSRTMSEWAALKRCANRPLEDTLPDTTDDGTTTLRRSWTGCENELTLLRIDGGGHTWPKGHQYLGPNTIGVVSRDWGNEVILNFFARHR